MARNKWVPKFEIGTKLGKLTVVEYLGRRNIAKDSTKKKNTQHFYRLKCECGNFRESPQQRLSQQRNPTVACVACSKQTIRESWSKKKEHEASEVKKQIEVVNHYWKPIRSSDD